MTLQWKRTNETVLRAEVPEGAYQIEGRSGKYHVWFYDRRDRQENVYISGHVLRMAWAKEAAQQHRNKFNSSEAWAKRAEAAIELAIEHLGKAVNVAPHGPGSTDYICATMLAQGVKDSLRMAENRRANMERVAKLGLD